MADSSPQQFDLIIVGAGSSNSIITPDFDDWSIAMVEKDRFGGTCLNVGCIPSKMFVYAADVASHIAHSSTYGIDSQLNGVDWPAIRDRVFGRIDPISAGGFDYRTGDGCANVTVFHGEATFVDEKQMSVALNEGGQASLTAPQIVLGAGARPFVPPIDGLDGVPYDTSDTVMRLEALPEKMIVLGGGYIACELGYVFSALGTEVTIVNRSGALLRAEDDQVSAAFTEAAAELFDLRLDTQTKSVAYKAGPDGGRAGQVFSVEVSAADGSSSTLEADTLLVATGRVPNGDRLNLDAAGIVHDEGRVLVDEHFATNVEGIWSFGDLASQIQLKHLANAQARAVQHNLLVAAGSAAVAGDTSLASVKEDFVPHAVFSNPQIASVGLTERDAAARGHDVITMRKRYGGTAYGWAMEDTTSFVKLVADRSTKKLLGAHIIGAQASTLIQPLIMGLEFDLEIDEIATKQFWIHPALTEAVENCLLNLSDALAGIER